ncbi:MAG: type I DNA topoisomerase [Arachnia sp.]
MADKLTRLVIVESPTKATKIAGYLGKDYVVESSRGHVRDLPTGAAEVPAKYKGEKWARTGVNVDDGFQPLYVVAADKKATIRSLKAKLADADELLLATDGDREGEAIAWHLLEELKPKIPAKRMVFHEITPSAIADAVEHPRDLDVDLVDAQETRRILDRLYGYEVSPVLWKKVMPKLSAGRVQSVATRLVVDRERERIAFVPAGYWGLDAVLDGGPDADPRTFPAKLGSLDGVKIATGRDFDASGALTSPGLVVLDEAAATAIAEWVRGGPLSVASVEAKPYTRRPYEPFRTTTLQQEAGRKLGFTSQRTMSVAQELYEKGFITYMRTDSVTLATSAINAARAAVTKLYGEKFLPAKPRVYASKVKNAQEAHEAIRPAGDTFLHPEDTGLSGDTFRLYQLVWRRTLASQMADAKGEQVSVKIACSPSAPLRLGDREVTGAEFTASGRTITFPGFLRAYVAGVDGDGDTDDSQARLPQLTRGQDVTVETLEAAGHETRPPARYTEPSLVAKLEELEIGRPSTYASIIRTITARDYVFKKGSALVPTWLAFAVTRLLEEHFAQLVNYEFTAQLEDRLDEIAAGDAKRLQVLSDFYRGPEGDEQQGLHTLVNELGEIDARELSTFPLGDSGMVVRIGRYGTYVEDSDSKRANVPEDLPPDALTPDVASELLASPLSEERELGTDAETGLKIVAKNGRYGPYVTEVLPEDAPKSRKPRTGSLFRSMTLDAVSLEQAQQLLSLPRVVGTDPDGAEITAQNGRYGPYLKRGTDSRSLTSEDQIFAITLDEALAIYAQPKTRGRAAAAAPLKEFGPDPVSEQPVVLKSGRFGPYVTDGQINATLRRDDDPEQITPERAFELIADKRAKGPATAKRTKAQKAPAKKAPARRAPARKAPATHASAEKAPKKA